MKKYVLYIIFISLYSQASYIQIEDQLFIKKLQNFQAKCGENYTSFSSYPITIGKIISIIENYNHEEISGECFGALASIKNDLKYEFFRKKSQISIQSSNNKYIFQDLSRKRYNKTGITYLNSNTIGNISYSFKFHKYDDHIIYDESFISFLKDNMLITVGKINRWWSPSSDTSLILSNFARPSPGIAVENYYPIFFENKFLSYLGEFNYSIFLNRLENDRHIPKPMLFGHRLSVKPLNNIEISLLRLAQFGGEGRNVDSQTIINMLLGKDNTNRDLDSEDEPGNQIAGIDFKISFLENHKLNIYGQYIGEDGLDPIIDDGWIGAIFPSKRFGQLGISYILNSNKFSMLSLERLTTDSGFDNVTYNHGIYNDGLRYYKKPIGASVDADSDRDLIKYETYTENGSIFEINLVRNKINKNNSHTNYWGSEYIAFNEINFNFNKKILNNLYEIELGLAHRFNNKLLPENTFFINIQKDL